MTLLDRLGHPWLTVRVQIALGVIFVAAALPKIVDPPSFAQMIYNYRILPGAFINLTALLLPWIELMAGLALILGIWRRTAAVIIGAMLLVFIVAIAFNLVRGNAIDCGCFNVADAGKSDEQRLVDMMWTIVRDVAMLAMVAQIWLGTRAMPPTREEVLPGGVETAGATS
ncbi:MAG TPA: MauE/DoxX family redox-associated membrane protein [Thermoanaerobaculia bacterium]|nr:MauE/DoxX family redox-associated membrane protein [Thermoanaerobaculia bacterium]